MQDEPSHDIYARSQKIQAEMDSDRLWGSPAMRKYDHRTISRENQYTSPRLNSVTVALLHDVSELNLYPPWLGLSLSN